MMKLFRDKIRARGARGIIGLQRVFKIMDDDGSKSLSQPEFAKAVRDFKMGIPEDAIPTLFEVFDSNRDGTINYDEFLRSITGDLNDFRRGLVGTGPGDGPLVPGLRHVERDLVPFPDVGILALDKAPGRFLPFASPVLHDRPAHARHLGILIVGGDVLVLLGREGPVLFEEGSVGVELLEDLPFPSLDFVAVVVTNRQQEVAVAILHALESEFEHPVTGERLTFEAPMPADFADTVAWLEEIGR